MCVSVHTRTERMVVSSCPLGMGHGAEKFGSRTVDLVMTSPRPWIMIRAPGLCKRRVTITIPSPGPGQGWAGRIGDCDRVKEEREKRAGNVVPAFCFALELPCWIQVQTQGPGQA